ncbi:unnamed protein product [Vitrella brassicaformis CCMP3155]|uniref:Uncharacterized protein n=1 Tax=Vitrella brassicaformis (strain CCMP3155) TaxID=1169540 RepID=A0A0G4E9S2_VITBC|nr:unnamed protein product [Vitrella brassicaformis CCMP3155]|eukprot:CEL91932.1 unnamed protein product [Vitrella brassicaformis CCMP3155]
MASQRNPDLLADLKRSTTTGSTAMRFGFQTFGSANPFGSVNPSPSTPPSTPGCGQCQSVRHLNSPLNPFRVGFKRNDRFVACVAMTPAIESAINGGTKQYKLVDNGYAQLIEDLTQPKQDTPNPLIGLQHHEAEIRGLSSGMIHLAAIMTMRLCKKHNYNTPLQRGASDNAAADRYLINPMNRADVHNPLANDLTAATHCVAELGNFLVKNDSDTAMALMQALPTILQDFATRSVPSSGRRRKTPSAAAAAAAAPPADTEPSSPFTPNDLFGNMDHDEQDADFEMYDDDVAIPRRDVIPSARYKTLPTFQARIASIPADLKQFMGEAAAPKDIVLLTSASDCTIDYPNVFDDVTKQQATLFASQIASVLPPAKTPRAHTAQDLLLSWGKRIDNSAELTIKDVINYVAIHYAINLRAGVPFRASQGPSVTTRGRTQKKAD